MSAPIQPPALPRVDAELIRRDEHQERQADLIAATVFGGEKNAESTADLIRQFVLSYEQHKHQMTLDHWLTNELRRYPTLWRDDAEAEATAREIIQNVEEANAAKRSLYEHLDAGRSRESWMAKRIEDAAAATGAISVANYANAIEQELLESSTRSLNAIYSQGEDEFGNWVVNGNLNLHGFVAEHDVANAFNIDATARQSGLRARVPGSTERNSADVVIENAAGAPLQDVQVKSYADVQQAISNIRAHNYDAGTVLLVHENQVERLQREFPSLRVTSRIEAESVSASLPSHEQLKAMQHDAQLREEARLYEWNDVNRITIARQIGKRAAVLAGLSAGMHGARILGRRLWNKIIGKENPPVSEDLKEFFESSIKSGAHVGVQVAVSGAVVVAAKNGWLGRVLQRTPAGPIVNAVYVGMENAKILYKFAKGEVTGSEALDAMGSVTCSTVGGLWGAAVGTVIGGFVGGVIGGMAGQKVGEAVWEGGKAFLSMTVELVKTAGSMLADAAKTFAEVLRPFNLFA